MVEHGLGQYAAGGVVGAEHQNIGSHVQEPLLSGGQQTSAFNPQSAPAQQFSVR